MKSTNIHIDDTIRNATIAIKKCHLLTCDLCEYLEHFDPDNAEDRLGIVWDYRNQYIRSHIMIDYLMAALEMLNTAQEELHKERKEA